MTVHMPRRTPPMCANLNDWGLLGQPDAAVSAYCKRDLACPLHRRWVTVVRGLVAPVPVTEPRPETATTADDPATVCAVCLRAGASAACAVGTNCVSCDLRVCTQPLAMTSGQWHDDGMTRIRLSTTVDATLLAHARSARAGTTDAALVDEALAALLARYRSAEVDASYAAYDEHPLDEPDEWGDLASFRRAAGAS